MSRKISKSGVNAATPPMTKSTMNEHEREPEASNGIIANTSSLNGTNKGLQESQVEHSAIAQIRLFRKEEYPIAMDAIKLFLDIHGSSSPNYYRTINKQIAAHCQMQGVHDINATSDQQLCHLVMTHKVGRAIKTSIELGLPKDKIKQQKDYAIEQTAQFFGLGKKSRRR